MYDITYPLSPNQALTREGFLICQNAVIASIGAREYRPEEVPIVEPLNGIVHLVRPESVLFAPETIDSFEGKPVTLDHPPDIVDGYNWNKYAVGTVSHVRKGEGERSGCLVADLIICDPLAIEAIRSRQATQLSCGFESVVTDQGNGIGLESSFTGNHVALVPEGRGGPTCSIADSLTPQSQKENPMFGNRKNDGDVTAQLLEQIKALTERVAMLEKGNSPHEPAPKETEPKTEEAPKAPEEEKKPEQPATAPEPEKKDEDPVTATGLEAAFAGLDPEKLGTALMNLIIGLTVDKKADQKQAKPEEVKNERKNPACMENDAAVIKDAADVAPSLPSNLPNLAYAAILEFAKDSQGKTFVESFGDLSKADHASVLKACASFKRTMSAGSISTANRNDGAAPRKSFVDQCKEFWKQ